jgi:hypothetical protein
MTSKLEEETINKNNLFSPVYLGEFNNFDNIYYARKSNHAISVFSNLQLN